MDRSQRSRVKALPFMTPQVFPRTNTLPLTHTPASGAFSQRSAAEADLGGFNLGCEVKGEDGVCERATGGA